MDMYNDYIIVYCESISERHKIGKRLMYEFHGYCDDQITFFYNCMAHSHIFFNKCTRHFTCASENTDIHKIIGDSSYIHCEDNIYLFYGLVGNTRKNNGHSIWTNKITGEIYKGQKQDVNYRRSTLNEIQVYYTKVKAEIDRKEKEDACKCAFCSNKENISNYLKLSIKEKILNIEYNAYSCDSSFNESIKINFCPMCGRKL